MTLEIHVLAWDRHKSVMVLNRLMGSHTPLYDLLFISALSLESELSTGEDYVPINWFNLVILLCLSHAHSHMSWYVLCSMV